MNNPLMYNDPSGEFLQFLIPIISWFASHAFASAVIIGAVVGLASYSLGVALTGQKWSLGGALKATFFGALGGAASFGVGEIFKVAAEVGKYATKFAQTIYDSVGGLGLAVVQAGTHAISQGVLGLMQGQSLASAALSGFAGSLAASGWDSAFGSSGVSMIAFGALSGGVGAELSGGNFWQGALIGGMVAGLNHAMHEMNENSIETESDNGNFTKSDNDDIIILIDKEGAGGFGHMAVLIGDDKNGWVYMSKDGMVPGTGNQITGGDALTTTKFFSSSAEALSNKSLLKYDSNIRFSTTRAQDFKAIGASYRELNNGRYHFRSTNCANVGRAALVGAGLNISPSIIPNFMKYDLLKLNPNTVKSHVFK